VLKKDLLDLDPQSRGNYKSGQAEKVTMAAMSAATSIPAAISSSLSFCKAQTKISDLRIDKVLICGGGARLRGLRGLLRENLRCPVEQFDPFANLDLSALSPEDAEQLQQMRHEAVVALGLAVGRLDDSLYSIEILPEAVRKKQRFQQRTIFNILAGVVIVALLFFKMENNKKEMAYNKRFSSKLTSKVARATNIHDEAEELLAENQVNRELVAYLRQRALPLHGVLRVQRAIGKHLSPQLWVEKLSVGGSRSRNGSTSPQVVVQVAAKELNGADTGRVLSEFSESFKSDPAMAGLPNASMREMKSQDSAQRAEITVDLESN
jgi:hypothetical protein